MAGTLTLVGTPIGNLGDLSPRARRALEEAETAPEDLDGVAVTYGGGLHCR